VARQQIVRATDGGVPPDIAGTEIALLQHGATGDAGLLGEGVVCRTTMRAADNDHVVSRLRFRLAPGLRPAAIAGEPLLQEGEGRIAHGSSWACAPQRLDTSRRLLDNLRHGDKAGTGAHAVGEFSARPRLCPDVLYRGGRALARGD